MTDTSRETELLLNFKGSQIPQIKGFYLLNLSILEDFLESEGSRLDATSWIFSKYTIVRKLVVACTITTPPLADPQNGISSSEPLQNRVNIGSAVRLL